MSLPLPSEKESHTALSRRNISHGDILLHLFIVFDDSHRIIVFFVAEYNLRKSPAFFQHRRHPPSAHTSDFSMYLLRRSVAGQAASHPTPQSDMTAPAAV